MKLKTITSLLSFLLIFTFTFAQKYPIAVPPGQRYTVVAEQDTLWILKNSQVNRALIAAKSYEVCLKQQKIYKEQVNNLKQQVAQLDTMYNQTKTLMEKYNDSYNKCKNDFDTVVKMYDRCLGLNRWYLIIGITASVLSFIAGAVIF